MPERPDLTSGMPGSHAITEVRIRLDVDEINRFTADGRTGRLNRYLVCRRR